MGWVSLAEPTERFFWRWVALRIPNPRARFDTRWAVISPRRLHGIAERAEGEERMGLVEGTGRTDATAPSDVEFYQPVLDPMRKMFGPERLIYASNWPVSERFAPLATVQSIVRDYFRSHGRRAEEQVFSRTARTAYKWVRRKKSPAKFEGRF